MRKNKGNERAAKASAVIAIILLATLAGCMKMEMGGRPIKKEMLAKIEPGKTTKNEIIQWFGAPAGIISPHQEDEWQQQMPLSPYMAYSASTVSNPFELFTPKHKISESYRVYYYCYIRSEMQDVIPFYTEMKHFKDELFILVDESNQLVIDYSFIPDKH
jgi:hypothetical protein